MTAPRLALHLAAGPDHVVRCFCAGAWHPAVFTTAEQASARFDRLRAINPHAPLERLIGDRVVEVSGAAAPQARAA